MLNIMEQSMSGTCGKMSLVLNGGSGRSRMSGLTKILFIQLFVVHQNNLQVFKKKIPQGEEIEIALISA